MDVILSLIATDALWLLVIGYWFLID